MKVWKKIPNRPGKYGWAFFYLLRKLGDKPRILRKWKDGSITVGVDGNADQDP